MSIMDPHIRVLHAEAAALTAQAMLALASGEAALEKENATLATVESTAAAILVRLSNAKLSAAHQLEMQEPKLREETPITITPRGSSKR